MEHVVGDEDEVPYFENIGNVHVDEAAGIATSDAVVVDLRAWSTRSCVTHHPEVVLHAEGHHSFSWESVSKVACIDACCVVLGMCESFECVFFGLKKDLKVKLLPKKLVK